MRGWLSIVRCGVLITVAAFASAALAAPLAPLSSPLKQAPLVLQVQVGPSGLINPQSDCRTIRTCSYTRNGSFRGCLSSFSCRVCQLVPTRCAIGANRANCHEMRCNWGG